MGVTRRFSDALNGGHLSEILDVATRGVLAAWESGEPEELAAALDLLRDTAPEDPPAEYDPTSYIEANEWVLARAMPESPHEYTSRGQTPVVFFEAFVRHINRHGSPGRYGKHTYTYCQIASWKYWTITGLPYYTRIINRARVGEKASR